MYFILTNDAENAGGGGWGWAMVRGRWRRVAKEERGGREKEKPKKTGKKKNQRDLPP